MIDQSLTRSPAASPIAGEGSFERTVHSLYLRRSQEMFGFVRRLGLDDEEASDAVQETMLDVCGVNPSAAPSAASNARPTPAATFELYIVRPGDNLQKIAAERNVQVWELELANPRIADLNHIVIGETLNIPGPGQMSPPSAAPSVP
jgi:LysM repeat protein